MEGIKEVIKQVEQKNSQTLVKKYKAFCKVCNKSFEFELIGRNFEKPEFCCQGCEEKDKEIRKKDYIQTQIFSHIPKKYWEIETDKEELLKSNIKKSLFITGGVGTGKTVFMASLAKFYIRKIHKIKWILYPEFIMALQNAYKNEICKEGFRGNTYKLNPFDMADTIAKFEGYLFIDDLGAEKLTDFVKQITYYILNNREQEILPTIITSNFSLEEIDEFVDRRVSSRICGMCDVLKFTGNDRRIK